MESKLSGQESFFEKSIERSLDRSIEESKVVPMVRKRFDSMPSPNVVIFKSINEQRERERSDSDSLEPIIECASSTESENLKDDLLDEGPRPNHHRE